MPQLVEDPARLAEVRALSLLDTASEARFDQITRLAADVVDMPSAMVSLVDRDRTWFKSTHGMDACEVPQNQSFCALAIENAFLEIEDARDDPRLRDNPLVVGAPHIRFYAGVTLRGPSGQAIGTLCVIDYEPRRLGETERRHLHAFAGLVEREFDRHSAFRELALDLQRQAMHDTVTGLPGASLFEDHLARTITEAESDENICVVHLHLVNCDALQLALGPNDAACLLRALADRLRNWARPIDQMGSLGVDRFAIAVRATCGDDWKDEHIARLVEELMTPTEFGQTMRPPVIAAGVSCYPADARNAQDLLNCARIAAGEAARRRQQFERYSPDTHQRASRRHDQSHRLAEALETNKLRQVYQPIVAADGRRLAGVEALARWSDAVYGEISPAEFIPVAEFDPNMSRALTRWSIDQACRQLVAWDAQNVWVPYVAVNLPPRELFRGDFVDLVRHRLAHDGVSPDRLVLEVTERSLIADIDTAIATMSALRRERVQFAIDDFGTGYSSLQYLQRLPVDFLKIDRCFTSGLDHSNITYSLIEGVLKIAASMNLKVVIEGVETEGQHAAAQRLGSEYLQGFLFGRPIGPEQFSRVVPKVAEKASRYG